MPALGFLEAQSVAEASPEARMILSTAPLCPTCRRVLRQLYDRLGTTLYYDDNPATLLRSFDVVDRTDCALRLLAACIVEFGRPRISVAGAVG